jgi:DNA-binding NarL/FixJ family response regulator
MSEPIRLLIVDDDPIVCSSLAAILGMEPGFEVAGTANDGHSAIELAAQLHPDIVLLDIRMPGMTGLDAARAILSEEQHPRVVFLTTFLDDDYLVAALRLGASGYLIKQDVAGIAPALRTVMSGQAVLGGEVLAQVDGLVGPNAGSAQNSGSRDVAVGSEPPAAAATAARSPDLTHLVSTISTGVESDSSTGVEPAPRFPELTERENQLVALIADGLDNREIAGSLFISEGTVRNTISAILAKLGLRNRTQIAIAFYRNAG